MRSPLALGIGPAVGAVALLVWASTLSWLRLSNLNVGTLWAELEQAFAVLYVLAACALWPAVAILRYINLAGWQHWLLGASAAGIVFGLVLAAAGILEYEGTEGFVSLEWSEVASACIAGCVTTVPSVVAYLLIAGTNARQKHAG